MLHQLGHNLLHLARQLADAGREVHIEARAQAKLLLDADEACLVVLEAPQALQDAVLRSRGALPLGRLGPGLQTLELALEILEARGDVVLTNPGAPRA